MAKDERFYIYCIAIEEFYDHIIKETEFTIEQRAIMRQIKKELIKRLENE